MITVYQRRINAEWLANQAPAVRAPAKEILKELQSLDQCLYWALDPEAKDAARDQWASSLIEHAHALLDMAHEYRAALKAKLCEAPQ